MRLLLDLRDVESHIDRRRLANEAEEHGLWGIVVTGPPGAECAEAAAIAALTDTVSILVDVDGNETHPTTLAEEIAVLDQISRRRTMIIFRGSPAARAKVADLLGGLPSDGFILSPPPAQASVPVYTPEDIPEAKLADNARQNAEVVDQHRDANSPFLIVSWNGSIKELARHLVGRAASPNFPQMIADLADQIDPID